MDYKLCTVQRKSNVRIFGYNNLSDCSIRDFRICEDHLRSYRRMRLITDYNEGNPSGEIGRTFPSFHETWSVMPYLQEPATDPDPDPTESSPLFQTPPI
jgi:hypothetical protein